MPFDLLLFIELYAPIHRTIFESLFYWIIGALRHYDFICVDVYFRELLFFPLMKPWLSIIQNFLGTREVGEFVSGALAGAMTKAVLAPLETIRLANWF